jgi:hypothetical protein
LLADGHVATHICDFLRQLDIEGIGLSESGQLLFCKLVAIFFIKGELSQLHLLLGTLSFQLLAFSLLREGEFIDDDVIQDY